MITHVLWGVKWRSRNVLAGKREHLMFHVIGDRAGLPALFKTREEAREWVDVNYGYIRYRPDLQREPHGWKVPVAVRVKVTA